MGKFIPKISPGWAPAKYYGSTCTWTGYESSSLLSWISVSAKTLLTTNRGAKIGGTAGGTSSMRYPRTLHLTTIVHLLILLGCPRKLGSAGINGKWSDQWVRYFTYLINGGWIGVVTRWSSPFNFLGHPSGCFVWVSCCFSRRKDSSVMYISRKKKVKSSGVREG